MILRCLRGFYEILMGFLCGSCAIPCYFYDLSMGFLWDSYGIPWYFYAIPIGFKRVSMVLLPVVPHKAVAEVSKIGNL